MLSLRLGLGWQESDADAEVQPASHTKGTLGQTADRQDRQFQGDQDAARKSDLFRHARSWSILDRLLFDCRTSPAWMAATVITKEGAGCGIVRAITLPTGWGDAAFPRRIGLAGRRWGGGQPGLRHGRASVQNVRIGIVECERARANTGVSVTGDTSAAAAKVLNEVMIVLPVSTDAGILGRSSNNGSSTGLALWGASFSLAGIRVLG